MPQNNTAGAGFREAAVLAKKHAQTFYVASKFLPKEQRRATYATYAMCWMSDEAVDNPNNAAVDQISRISANIDLVYSDAAIDNGLLAAFKETITRYDIPKLYFDHLLCGMRMDLDKNHYADFNELYQYCYNVAGVIGLIMLKIFNCQDSQAQKCAVDLGIAMQLTNILRDIKEDLQKGRIYLPQDELIKFQVNESDIIRGKIDEKFITLLSFQIKRARDYYDSAGLGLSLINNKRFRLATICMKELYSGILDNIEKNNYDVFTKRAHISSGKKMACLFKMMQRSNKRNAN